MKNMQTFTYYFACYGAFPIHHFLKFPQVVNSVTDKEMD